MLTTLAHARPNWPCPARLIYVRVTRATAAYFGVDAPGYSRYVNGMSTPDGSAKSLPPIFRTVWPYQSCDMIPIDGTKARTLEGVSGRRGEVRVQHLTVKWGLLEGLVSGWVARE